MSKVRVPSPLHFCTLQLPRNFLQADLDLAIVQDTANSHPNDPIVPLAPKERFTRNIAVLSANPEALQEHLVKEHNDRFQSFTSTARVPTRGMDSHIVGYSKICRRWQLQAITNRVQDIRRFGTLQ